MTALDVGLVPGAPAPAPRRTIPEHLRHLAGEYGAVLDHEHLPALADTLRQHLLVTADRAEVSALEADVWHGEAADRERAVSVAQRVLAALAEAEACLPRRMPARAPAFEDGARWALERLRQALGPGVVR